MANPNTHVVNRNDDNLYSLVPLRGIDQYTHQVKEIGIKII
jgi:hypothetical protein